MRSRRTILGCAVAVVATAVALGAVAQGAAPLPKPGTAAQVAALVAKSSSIKVLPSDLVPPLSEVGGDFPGAYYPAADHACRGVNVCVFGHLRSRRVVVLFGDSHAQMWLPALVPVAERDDLRLSLVWLPGCPAATVSVWDAGTHSINVACNAWRTSMVRLIKKLKPNLVLLASRTSDIPGPLNHPTTNAMWQAGLETTISELKTTRTKVAVVGDITVFSPVPLPQCLAANPTSIQTCSVNNPNGKTRQHFAAERAAAVVEDVPYIDPQPWLCTTTCSPIVGRMAVYFDTFHVAATYAAYLSGVWSAALRPLLTPPTTAGS